MIAIYLIAGIVALVWAAIYVLRGSLIGGCLVFLITAVCFGHNFLHFDLGPIPLTLDRLALGLLLVAYVVGRRRGQTDPKPLCGVDVLLMLFLGVLVLSAGYGGWNGNPTGLVGRFDPLFRLTAGYLIPFAVYWIARQSPLDRRAVSLAQAVLTGLGVYLAVTGLLEISGQWWAVFPRYIADPKVGIHFGRARGPMVQSVSFGLCLSVCMLAAWLWRWRPPTSKDMPATPPMRRFGQLLIFALMPLMLAGIYFSYTRSVWIGTGLGLAGVLGLTLRGVWRPLVLGGMVSGTLLLAVTRMDKLVDLEREQSGIESGKSVDLRASFAYISWKMFLDRPFWGVGFGQFPDAKMPYLSDHSTTLDLEAARPYVHHSTFFSLLAETGFVGWALYLAVLAGWARTAWELCRGPGTDGHHAQHGRLVVPDWARAQGVLLLGVLAVYGCQVVFQELSYTPIDNSLVFFLAGITVGLRPLAGKR
jgi:hypothetical protein